MLVVTTVYLYICVIYVYSRLRREIESLSDRVVNKETIVKQNIYQCEQNKKFFNQTIGAVLAFVLRV
jgi:hypothetical protein